MENGGKNCLVGCNKEQGKCDWCGMDGWCCRKDSVGNGCDGTFGGINDHQCVLKPGNPDYVINDLCFYLIFKTNLLYAVF